MSKYKHQNTNKFQMTISNEFGILVIVICDLEFFSETKTFLQRPNRASRRSAAGLNGEPRTRNRLVYVDF